MTEPAPPTRRRRTGRRRHPASGARIGTAGFGLATMFGLVGVMGLSRTPSPSQTGSATGAPSHVIVVIHRPNTTAPTTSTGGSRPITLRARPTVRGATPVPSTPTARTHGSR